MIRVIIYYRKMTHHLPVGYVNLKILAVLLDGRWQVLDHILKSMRASNTLNKQRVKADMIGLKKLEVILDKDDWNELRPEQRKEEYGNNFRLERAVEEHGAKNLYKITLRGRTKFDKIKNDCLDPITQQILHLHKKEDN